MSCEFELIVRENMHTESTRSADGLTGRGLTIEADEQRRGVQRDRGDGTRGDALCESIVSGGNKGNPSQKSADCCAVIGTRNVHVVHGRYYSVHTAKAFGISLLLVL